MSDEKFAVTFAPSVVRDLASPKIPRRVIDAALMFIEGPLAEAPWRVGKPLVGPLVGTYSARREDFRILYTVDFDARRIRITGLSHRSDAYGQH
ncbi:toxin RelG [Amorphoplanes digitatis]|nr:type II toxin-antitoxin system RelE/ParE family toxin [Actinoplanes digitatis]GID97435.1 toxin RelG [Actinoplanes digitatis]